MQYIKKSETELEVVKTPVVEPVKTVYDLDFLKSQELTILEDMNNYVEKRKAELEETRTLISECEKLGVKSKREVEEAKTSDKIIEEETKLDTNLK